MCCSVHVVKSCLPNQCRRHIGLQQMDHHSCTSSEASIVIPEGAWHVTFRHILADQPVLVVDKLTTECSCYVDLFVFVAVWLFQQIVVCQIASSRLGSARLAGFVWLDFFFCCVCVWAPVSGPGWLRLARTVVRGSHCLVGWGPFEQQQLRQHMHTTHGPCIDVERTIDEIIKCVRIAVSGQSV